MKNKKKSKKSKKIRESSSSARNHGAPSASAATSAFPGRVPRDELGVDGGLRGGAGAWDEGSSVDGRVFYEDGRLVSERIPMSFTKVGG